MKLNKKGKPSFQNICTRLLLLLCIAAILPAASCSRTDQDVFLSASSSRPAGTPPQEPDVPRPEEITSGSDNTVSDRGSFSLSSIPPYAGNPWIPVHDNIPLFTESDRTTISYEEYGELDSLGRCTGAVACIGQDLLPAKERESISEIRPSGWQLVKYDGIDGNYLYNRCHLIAYGLTAENANERNLITGTRYMNTEGMNPFENRTIAYIRNTGHHVLYRVTPVFEGDNLLASGVLMEGMSVEDRAISFCVYVYNVQPGIVIDYSDGTSSGIPFTGAKQDGQEQNSPENENSREKTVDSEQEYHPPSPETTYVVNTSSCKFHRPTCSAVRDIKEKNRWDSIDSRNTLLKAGYEPCKICRP